MTKKTLLHRCAGSAIAAALALASTPTLAQQADPASPPPEVVLPVPPVTATPATPNPAPVLISPVQPQSSTGVPVPTTTPTPVQPRIVLPDTVTSSEQVAAPSAADPAGVVTAAESTSSEPARTGVRTSAAPAPAPRQSAPANSETGVAGEAEVLAAPLPAAGPAPRFSVDDGAVVPVEADSSDSYAAIAWLLAGLGAVGFILLGLIVASLRRRTRSRLVERVPPHRPSVARQAPAASPVVTAVPSSEAARPGLPLEPPVRRDDVLDWSRPRVGPAACGLATAGAAVPLPRRKPATVAERTTLIDRLAGAQPDRANPFRAPKARRRRARLIVQSLDREFRNGSRIDLSQYPANWPHLARRAERGVA